MTSVHVLAEFSERKALTESVLDDTRQAFSAMVQVEEKKRAEKAVFEKQKAAVGVDDLFSIRQLAKKSEGQGIDEIELDLDQAMGGDSTSEDLTSKLSRVVQLTGFSDPGLCRSICQSPPVRHRFGRSVGQPNHRDTTKSVFNF